MCRSPTLKQHTIHVLIFSQLFMILRIVHGFFLMKNKSESVLHLTHFLEYVATQFNSKVQTICSDNAK